MRVQHRVIIDGADKRVSFWLRQHGLESGIQDNFVDLDDDDPRFRGVLSLPEGLRSVLFSRAKFSEREIVSASCAVLSTTWVPLYPQPDDPLLCLKQSYNLERYCSECGAGAIQTAPIRVKKDPDWKARAFMGIHWIPDALVVKSTIYDDILKPYVPGIHLVRHSTGDSILSSIQLRPDRQVKLDDTGLKRALCQVCGITKYSENPGFAPSALEPVVGIMMGDLWFGSGSSAYKLIYADSKLIHSLVALRDKHLQLTPALAF